jgi:predicted ATP-dependent endonuclease of OLD family
MIDEVELHQEEIMQRKLLHALQAMGSNNQLIVATHSSYLAEIVPHESLITMGYLSTEESQTQDVTHA